MTDAVREFYDTLASDYHLMFEDWEASITRQAAALATLLERECGPAASTRVLDCACGIGTQALGLARLGFQVTGSDLSPRAVERAHTEAARRALDVPFYVADMRDLSSVPGAAFDAVICMDNALPHLLSNADLAQTSRQIRSRLRPGGTLVASIRDYDELLTERPVVQGPGFVSQDGRRRIVFQLWDWEDERRYTFHLYITRQTADGWTTFHGASVYSAIRRGELAGIFSRNGFAGVRWLLPQESGYYQPVVVCTAGD